MTKLEDAAVVTDQYELINKVVDRKIKSYVVYIASEHQDTRTAFKQLEAVVLRSSSTRVWALVNSAAIVLILLGMLLFL